MVGVPIPSRDLAGFFRLRNLSISPFTIAPHAGLLTMLHSSPAGLRSYAMKKKSGQSWQFRERIVGRKQRLVRGGQC